MCAYDTTIIDSLETQGSAPQECTPACLERNLLDNKYFPSMTSAALVAIIALGGIYLATSFNRLNHTDLWGHLNFGRWIVEHGALPAADPFAAETRPASFLNVPWLAQVSGFLVLRAWGPEGLILCHALLVTLACGVMMAAVRKRGASSYGAVAAGISLFLLSLPIVGTIRPQLFGMLGGSLVLWACVLLPQRKHPLFWLPAVFLLWANLHGSFVMGIAMLGMASLGESWDVWKESGSFTRTIADRRFQQMWLATAFSLAACCLNPNGPLLLLKVLAFGNNASLSYISEWRSLSPRSFSGILFFGSLAVGAALLRFSKRRLEPRDILMLSVFGLATLTAMRMLAWWAMVWSWAMIPLADDIWRRLQGDEQADEEKNAMTTVIAMGVVFMCLLLAPPSQSLISGRPRGIAATTSSDTPLFVAERLAQQKMTGRIFSPMDWADYLVWCNPDRIQPLVYSHVHLLHPETFQEYQRIGAADPAWRQLAEKNQLKYLVINRERNSALLRAVLLAQLAENPWVRVIYQDQQAVLAELLPVGDDKVTR